MVTSSQTASFAVQIDPALGPYAEAEGVLVVRWDRRVDAVSTPAWAALADRFAKTPGAKLIVVVVHPYVAPPSLDQRDAMGAVQLALTKAGVTAGLVILGAGFGASLKLGFATALTLFSKATRPMIVVSDLESLAAKLPSSLASVRGTLLELGAAVEKPPRRTYGAA